MILKGRIIYLLVLGGWMGAIWALLAWSKNWQEAPPVGNNATTTQIYYPVFFATYIAPAMPEANAFVTPMLPPDGAGVTITLAFQEQAHLGEDWATGPGNASDGQPVYSIGDGFVSVAQDFQSIWGKVVMVCYKMPTGRWPPVMEVMYAQLGSIDAVPGTIIYKGQKLGTIGTLYAGNTALYKAHLHWEIRQAVDLGPGSAFNPQRDGWLSPSEQLKAHRGDRGPFQLQMKTVKPEDQKDWGTDL